MAAGALPVGMTPWSLNRDPSNLDPEDRPEVGKDLRRMHLDVLHLVGLADRALGVDEVRDTPGEAGGTVGGILQHVVGLCGIALRVGQKLEGQPPGLCKEFVLGGGVERRSEDLRPRLGEPLGSVTEPLPFLGSAAGGGLGEPPEHDPAPGEIGKRHRFPVLVG